MEKTKENDFVEIEYTGYSDGKVFDSNIPEDLKKINPEAKVQKTEIIIGQNMVVPGLDKALPDKEVGKEYDVKVPSKDGFGPRNRDLIKTIPLSSFKKHNMNPQPGMVVFLDNNLAKILSVSGARVIADLNNPMAGKDLEYKFKIKRIITDTKEKTEAFFNGFFRHVPEFEVKDKVTVKGTKEMKALIDMFKPRFKELVGKDLDFKEEMPKKEADSNKTPSPQ